MNTNKKNKIKCVVWDLDDTLWTGILSENDPLSLRSGIGDIIASLDNRGILNSIASRNNADQAIDVLETFSLREYFVYPQIGWNLKSEAIKTIKSKLNIGYDTIAFIDDQEFEIEEVKSVHPEVRCFGVNEIQNLLQMDEFSTTLTTEEGKNRRLMYLTDEQRNQEEIKFNNNIDFLFSLKMRMTIRGASVSDLKRVEELTLRTNQLNATGYTYSYEELNYYLMSPIHKIFVVELEDKFGSYGKIGVTLLEIKPSAIIIKLLLVSCRVISRGVGNGLISFIINEGITSNKKVQAEFLPTNRNNLMYMTYKFANFKEVDNIQENGVLFEYRGPCSFVPYSPYLSINI